MAIAASDDTLRTVKNAPMRRRRLLTATQRALAAAVLFTTAVACSTEPSRPDVPMQSGQQTVHFEAAGFSSLAADTNGTVYAYGAFGIATLTPDKLVPLANGSPAVSTLAAGTDGTLYFVTLEHAVEKLSPGSTTPQPLPFGELRQWSDIAVGADGTVYLGDNQNDELLTLAPGADAPTERPIDGLESLGHMVIDHDGNLFASMGGKIVKIAKDSTTAEPVPGASNTVGGLAVDAAGNLYATDRKAGTVSRWPVDGGDWAQLPFHDIQSPGAITVDPTGNVYVIAAQRNTGSSIIELSVG